MLQIFTYLLLNLSNKYITILGQLFMSEWWHADKGMVNIVIGKHQDVLLLL